MGDSNATPPGWHTRVGLRMWAGLTDLTTVGIQRDCAQLRRSDASAPRAQKQPKVCSVYDAVMIEVNDWIRAAPAAEQDP